MIESVYIPDADRATLCVSSQIGCKMNCSFCMTGKQGYHGDLTAAEILNQIFSIPESLTLTNIVLWAWASRWTTTSRWCVPSPC